MQPSSELTGVLLGMVVRACRHIAWQVGAQRLAQSHSQLPSKCEASLGYQVLPQESKSTNSPPHKVDISIL